MRKVPIYILINTSSSISNETLQKYKDCLNLLIDTLKSSQYARDITISLMTFGYRINRLCSLSPLESFKIPPIKIGEEKGRFDYALDEFIISCEWDRNSYVLIFTDNAYDINIANGNIKYLSHLVRKIIIVCKQKDWINSDIYESSFNIIICVEALNRWTICSRILTEFEDYGRTAEPPMSSPPHCSSSQPVDSSPRRTNGALIQGPLSSIFGGLGCMAVSLADFISTSYDELREKNHAHLLRKHIKTMRHYCKIKIEELSSLNNALSILEKTQKYNKVYSSIFAPAEVKRKSHLLVQIYLHLFEEAEMVKSLAKESDKNAERRDYTPLLLNLKNSDKVDVEFNVYGEGRLMSERKSVIWQGAFTKCSFDFFVPKDIDVDDLSCEANLFVNGAMIGEMRFITQIVDAPRNRKPEILSHRFNKIFISYAHQDAQQIKLLALAYKAQGIDYFYDRDSLAVGDVYEEKIFEYIDSADLFVLCWSKNAALSDYVAKEKGRALLRAYPHLSRKEATLKICPISIEPRADLPSDMQKVYNFEVI